MKTFDIGGKGFKLPTTFTYRQYSLMMELFRDSGINLGESINVSIKDGSVGSVLIQVGSIIANLTKKDTIPRFFATALIPEDADIWKASFVEDNVEKMYDITDDIMVEVFTSFLAMKKESINSLIQSYTKYQKK